MSRGGTVASATAVRGNHTGARGQPGEDAVGEQGLEGVGVPGGPVNPISGGVALNFAGRQTHQALEDLMADALKPPQAKSDHQALLGGSEEPVQEVGPEQCQRPAGDGIGFPRAT
jgi:hypothetical protein